jgi:hypothetical protein
LQWVCNHSGGVREGKNLRRSLGIWVRESKSREDAGEGNDWAGFEKHVDR